MSKLKLWFCVSLFLLLNTVAVLSGLEKGCVFQQQAQSFLHTRERLIQNIKQMEVSNPEYQGMDVVIVCSSTPQLSDFWKKRLETTRSHLLSGEALIICVDEDWNNPSGAGNGLGTLYAFRKAQNIAQDEHGIDLLDKLADGSAIAMYHTAGMGKRLAPLTISEYGVKSAVKLPGLISSPDEDNRQFAELITLLEATIKQSSIFASSRKGRLSVFWSDQVFIPSNSCKYASESHIDILVKKIPEVSSEVWKAQNLENYGLAIWDETRAAKLFDKCDYDTFHALHTSYYPTSELNVGISMGTFSLSQQMIRALLEEFKPELADKTLLLDSDPYFWMPMTLDWNSYSSAMQSRKVSVEEIKHHYDRMQKFKTQFLENTAGLPGFFQAIDIGSESFWWDYGTVQAYYQNNIKMLQNSLEGSVMRLFYNIPPMDSQSLNNVQTLNSKLLGSKIESGNVKDSLVIGVNAGYLQLDHCIMIGSKVCSLEASHALLYNVNEEGEGLVDPYYVRADVRLPDDRFKIPFFAPMESDGKKNWKIKLPQNPCSWEEASRWVVGELLPQ